MGGVVFNDGKSETEKDLLDLNFGVFFDGTLNNKENTRLRILYRNKGKENLTDKELKAAYKEEKAAYKKLKAQGNTEYDKNDTDYNNYIKAIQQSFIDKVAGENNSYVNDYSNVARMQMCCEEAEYAVYIEGIGSLNQQKDVQSGFMYGLGHTGIRAKVRKACEELVTKIEEKKGKGDKTTLSSITIDVFGFSRGAAAARNFIYEVNQRKGEFPFAKKIFNMYSDNQGHTWSEKHTCEYYDRDGFIISKQYLVDGKLPRCGHLGLTPLEKRVLNKEELNKLIIIIRFAGLYDTVSSYEEMGDKEASGNLWAGIKDTIKPEYFSNDVEDLQLNNLGFIMKSVHFTAMNEHRKNFALTRMLNGIEKNLPGVHADIGGCYNSGEEYVDELETFHYVNFTKPRALRETPKKLLNFKKYLTDQHWYKEKELKIWNQSARNYTQLSGTRNLKKEYSYIPLQFMYEFCLPYMKEYFMRPVEEDYPIEQDKILVKSKKYLESYVFFEDRNGGKSEYIENEWKKEKEKESEINEKENPENKFQIYPEEDQRVVYDNLDPEIYKKDNNLSKKNIEEIIAEDEEDIEVINLDINPTVYHIVENKEEIEEINLGINPTVYHIGFLEGQKLLRTLRNEYIHWSADKDWFGMAPAKNRKRIEY